MAAQVIAGGLALGALYALVALGFSLVWNASRSINFAQGELVMIGGFIAYTFGVIVGVEPHVAFVATLAVAFLLGLVFERLVIRPVRRQSSLTFVIVTIGVAVMLQNVARIVWGAQTFRVPSMFPETTLDVGGALLLPQDVGILVIAVAIMLGHAAFFRYTITGIAMRAVAEDRETAHQLGVPADRMVALTSGLNLLLAAAAGALLGPIVFISATMGLGITLKAFVAAILGGFGNPVGAVVGGLAIGLAQTLGTAYVSSAYSDVLTFAIMILALLVRPRGLFAGD